jgi:hypothetical protein
VINVLRMTGKVVDNGIAGELGRDAWAYNSDNFFIKDVNYNLGLTKITINYELEEKGGENHDLISYAYITDGDEDKIVEHQQEIVLGKNELGKYKMVFEVPYKNRVGWKIHLNIWDGSDSHWILIDVRERPLGFTGNAIAEDFKIMGPSGIVIIIAIFILYLVVLGIRRYHSRLRNRNQFGYHNRNLIKLDLNS